MNTEKTYPTVTGVIAEADFAPYWEGEDFVTVTFRVPKDTQCPAGCWSLTPIVGEKPEWSRAKSERK